MKIELCEDNGCFKADGVPSLVILQITRDDGKVVRLPYEAGKTLAELYADVAKMVHKAPAILPIVSEMNLTLPATMERVFPKGDIEREDIVKCVKLHPRDPGSDIDLKVGDEYRVIGKILKDGQIIFYEVLDDNSLMKIRIPVYPDEIELLRKHVPPPPRKQTFEMTKKCPTCGEFNSLELNGNHYSGNCIKCGLMLREARPGVQSTK